MNYSFQLRRVPLCERSVSASGEHFAETEISRCAPDNLKIAILAGALGTPLAEKKELKPRPMVEIGRRPILWHILKHDACYGHREFFIALGYKGDEIKGYFLAGARLRGDMTLRPARSEVLELSATCHSKLATAVTS